MSVVLPPPTPGDHPRLPAWMPVLRRGPDQLQIGLDPDTGVVLSGIPPALDPVLSLLDGTHPLESIRSAAAAAGIGAELLDRVLSSLTTAGLLGAPATAQPVDPAALGIRLIGAGRLGRAVARAVVDARIGQLWVVDRDPVDPEVHPDAGLAATQADALRTTLRAAADRVADLLRTEIRVTEHWSLPDHRRPDLTVIAADYAEPDRAIGEEYVRADHPHIYLRPLHAGVVVGPLVRPGRSPCLACQDHRRREADPAWPTLLAQLCRTRTPVTPLIASWAAATAITQVLADLSGTATPVLAGTMETTPADGTVRFRQWPMHPRCGCAWHN